MFLIVLLSVDGRGYSGCSIGCNCGFCLGFGVVCIWFVLLFQVHRLKPAMVRLGFTHTHKKKKKIKR